MRLANVISFSQRPENIEESLFAFIKAEPGEDRTLTNDSEAYWAAILVF